MLTSKNFDGLDRKEYVDLEPLDWKEASDYPIASPKYDGIWCRLLIHRDGYGGTARYFSRTNKLKHSRNLLAEEVHLFPEGNSVFIGEFMFGQEWAQHDSRKDSIYIWDCLVWGNNEMKDLLWSTRIVPITRTFPKDKGMFRRAQFFERHALPYRSLWEHFVNIKGFEGLIFIRPSTIGYDGDVYARMKAEYEDDLYIVGFEGGAGRLSDTLGALVCARSKDEKLHLIMVGGGLSDSLRDKIWKDRNSYLGRCLTVKSNKRFESGSLRSPQFVRFHPEK